MSEKNCFFFPYSLFKNLSVTNAMKEFLIVNKKKNNSIFLSIILTRI